MCKKNKIIITFVAVALVLLAHLKLLDDVGLAHTEKGLNRALVTYGVSRGLNGIISVVQGTEVAIEPVGVGMTFTPGQILDPVNDLIERFSTLVLVSGTAFGVQRVLLDVVSSDIFSILIGLNLLMMICLMWFSKTRTQAISVLVYRCALVLLIIRFSIPLTAIAGENFYHYFLQQQYQSSSQQLLSTTDQLRDIQAQTEPKLEEASKDKSFFDSARELYQSASNKLDMQKHIDDFKVAAENISEHAIKLMVVFIFQTMILPLSSVWLTLKALKWAMLRKVNFRKPA